MHAVFTACSVIMKSMINISSLSEILPQCRLVLCSSGVSSCDHQTEHELISDQISHCSAIRHRQNTSWSQIRSHTAVWSDTDRTRADLRSDLTLQCDQTEHELISDQISHCSVIIRQNTSWSQIRSHTAVWSDTDRTRADLRSDLTLQCDHQTEHELISDQISHCSVIRHRQNTSWSQIRSHTAVRSSDRTRADLRSDLTLQCDQTQTEHELISDQISHCSAIIRQNTSWSQIRSHTAVRSSDRTRADLRSDLTLQCDQTEHELISDQISHCSAIIRQNTSWSQIRSHTAVWSDRTRADLRSDLTLLCDHQTEHELISDQISHCSVIRHRQNMSWSQIRSHTAGPGFTGLCSLLMRVAALHSWKSCNIHHDTSCKGDLFACVIISTFFYIFQQNTIVAWLINTFTRVFIVMCFLIMH